MIKTGFSPTVVLVDGDYMDSVAFDLIVNFERMIGRAIPQADLCHWIDCASLDGGLRPGENVAQVIFLHSKERAGLENFKPSHYADEIDGKAFKDHLAEFCMLAFPVEEVVSAADFFVQSLESIAECKEVERIIVVADMAKVGERIKRVCGEAKGKDITLLTMEPTTGRGFAQEILGYSLMSALGIGSNEIKG